MKKKIPHKDKPSVSSHLVPPQKRGRRWDDTALLLAAFLLFWLWASWWMGDVLRIAYERSFFAPNATLMHWLNQQSFGMLWIAGRALLTIYHWPVLGGLLVASLLTAAAWLINVALRVPTLWRWTTFLPASAWMSWTAWAGLDLYYIHEPGRILALPLLLLVFCIVLAAATWGTRRFWTAGNSDAAGTENSASAAGKRWHRIVSPLLLLLLVLLPTLLLHERHPYLRPLTRMQVQLMEQDYEGMVATAHEHATLSYRPLAAYYAIGLARTGHLTDQLFDIRLEYDTIYAHSYEGEPEMAPNYYIVDCNYHAGLIRPAMHRAVEELTMDGPSLFTLKHLARMALIEREWALARKYFHIIRQAPFEGEFLEQYEPMLEQPQRVLADPEIASLLQTAPIKNAFENQFEKPCFLGYFAVIGAGKSMQALHYSIMANLYSKRMPDFLARCEMFIGTTPPRSIAEGLVTQSFKNPAVLQAFPQLQLDAQRYQNFIKNVQPYIKDRERGGEELFEQYRGYYPYYYLFENLRATRKNTEKTDTQKAGVN